MTIRADGAVVELLLGRGPSFPRHEVVASTTIAVERRCALSGLQAFFRYKRILGGRLRAIVAEPQEREALIGCDVLNKMAELGMPESYSIA